MIVSSKIIEQRPQPDGRVRVTELHIDDSGREHLFTYLAEKNSDPAKILAERADMLNQPPAEEAKPIVIELRFDDAQSAEAAMKMLLAESVTDAQLTDAGLSVAKVRG